MKSLSKVIKQNYVAVSSEKKIIQNAGKSRFLHEQEETIDNAPMRVVKEIADNLQSEAKKEDAIEQTEISEIDLSEYQAEADKIIADAKAAKEQIYQETYDAAMEDAKEELANKLDSLKKEYDDRRDALEVEMDQKYKKEYDNEINQLEAKMVLWMKTMLSKLVGQAQKNEKILLHLIRTGMREIPLQGDLIIRVSEEDLDYVLKNKDLLTEELSEKLIIEILKDKSLKKNECVIETIMGNIECSLGVQLKGITDELNLIYESIMKNVNN